MLDRLFSDDPIISRLQDNIEKALGSKGDAETSEALEFTFTAAETVTVKHNLRKEPTGWTVVDLTGTGLYVVRSAWSTTSLSLEGSAAGTAKVKVF